MKKIKKTGKRIYLPALFFFTAITVHAQLIPLHTDYTNEVNSLLSGSDSVRYTAIKPLFFQNQAFMPDSV